VSKRKRIYVLDKEFKSKKDFEEYIRKLRDSYHDGEFLIDADFEFMMTALERHENFDEIIGDGIAKIMIRLVLPYNNHLGFFPVRRDGSIDSNNFSFLKCVDTPSLAALAKKAFRDEVEEIKARFKRKIFMRGPVICPITKKKIRIEEAIVHHEPKFENLRTAFLLEKNIKIEHIKVKHISSFYLFEDKSLKNDWIAWHDVHAHLLIVSYEGHKILHAGGTP